MTGDSSAKLSDEKKKAILDLPLVDLVRKLQNGDLKAKEVLEAYQLQALAVHRKTNCLIEPILEASSQAEECDLSTDKSKPLHGVPVSIKDNYGVEGYDSTAGCSEWIDKPFPSDAVVVKILKEQGAIPFVKTNIPQTMLSWETTNPIFGETRNPHDTSRGVGGSSGGEAALIAGGGSPLGFGSDIGGSIRIPSNMCGTCGFKPPSGRISSIGTHPIYKGQTCVKSTYGPMSRDVDGLVVAMKAMLVPAMFSMDTTIAPIPFNTELFEEKRKLRIGYYIDDSQFTAVPAMVRGVHLARKVLESLGHEVIPWNFPNLYSSSMHFYSLVMFGDRGNELKTLLKDDALDSAVGRMVMLLRVNRFLKSLLYYVMKLIEPRVASVLADGYSCKDVTGWFNVVKDVEGFRCEVTKDWKQKGLDAIICPGFACPALPFGAAADALGAVPFTATYNVLDFPAGSLPVTKVTESDETKMKGYPSGMWHHAVKKGMRGSTGLPVNVQVVTLPWKEELCLRVMKELETGLAKLQGK